MISEPEMEGRQDTAEPVDLVSHADRPPLLGRFTPKPWTWALGAVVVTSALWAGALRVTGYGHTAAPDLHGYHIGENPCTNQNLQPLADDLSSLSFGQNRPAIIKTGGLDHVMCDLIGTTSTGDGWRTTYTVTLTIDLHKKTDPTAEFEAARRIEIPAPDPVRPGTIAVIDERRTTTPVRGIGDEAYMVAGRFRQEMYVRHGGAVFSMTLDGTNDWDASRGKPPTDAEGAAVKEDLADTTAFRKDLKPTLHRLMSDLAAPE
jgi:hypothetical protein